MKKCRLCDEIKSFINFPKRSSSKDGYRNECHLCIKESNIIKNANLTIEEKNLINEKARNKIHALSKDDKEKHNEKDRKKRQKQRASWSPEEREIRISFIR